MDKVLFIGNGINRLTKGERGWAELLKDISFFAGDGPMAKPSEFKPLPLFLEEIILRKEGMYDVVLMNAKNYIMAVLSELKHNEFHARLLNSNIKHILTTNYDYGFEKYFKPNYFNIETTEEQTSETKHSIKRKKILPNGKTIWHIHGEINQIKGLGQAKGDHETRSIMIGYDHYSEYLIEIQNYIYGKRSKSSKSIKEKLKEGNYEAESWIDLFFTHNIVICGFDFSFSENHLWWLLNYRAKENNNRIFNGEKGLENEIIYVYPVPPEITIEQNSKLDDLNDHLIKMKRLEAKLEMLNAMQVKHDPIHIPAQNDYVSFYNQFIEKYLNNER